MAGTSSAKTRFALLPGHDEETVILRCEPTGPREARPDDRLREPRRMTGEGVCGTSFEARKSAHLRMTAGLQVQPPVSPHSDALPADIPPITRAGSRGASAAWHPR